MFMGLIILKFVYHFKAELQKKIWKLMYFKKISFGKGVTWRDNMHFYIDGGRILIGDECFFNHGCSLISNCMIQIGKGCLFGENVKIYDNNHRFSDITIPIKEQGYSNAPVIIGNNCWIGSNVVILKGVTVGNNCVVAAGTVVRNNVPDNTIISMDTKYKYNEINLCKITIC